MALLIKNDPDPPQIAILLTFFLFKTVCLIALDLKTFFNFFNNLVESILRFPTIPDPIASLLLFTLVIKNATSSYG